MISKCKKCGKENFSQFCKIYAKLYGCYHCDKALERKGKLSYEEIEEREKQILELEDFTEKIIITWKK